MVDPPGHRGGLLKASRLLLWSLPVLAGGVLLLGGIVYAAAASPWGNGLILDQVLPRIQPQAGSIRVAGLRTDLFHHLSVDGFELVAPDGAVLIRVDHADADLDLVSAFGGELGVSKLRADGLLVDIADPAVFSQMWPGDPNAPPWSGLPIDVVVDDAEVAGTVRVGAWAVIAAKLQTAVTVRGRQVQSSRLRLDGLTNAGPLALDAVGAWSPGRLVLQSAHAAVGTTHTLSATLSGAIDGDRLALHVPTAHLDLVALTALVPAAGVAPLGSPIDAAIELSGTLSTPSVAGTLRTAGGALLIDAGVDVSARTWRANVSTESFDSAPVLVGIEPVKVLGSVVATGTGWTWPEALDLQADGDLVVEARGETIRTVGPLSLHAGVLHLDGFRADAEWGAATATGDVDILARHLELQVQGARARLARFRQQGLARFDGGVVADWAGPVTVQARGNLVATDLGVGGVTVARASGPVDAGWDGRYPTGRLDLQVADVRMQDRHASTGRVRATLGDRIGFDVALDEPDRSIATATGSFTTSTGVLELQTADVELANGLRAIAQGTQRVRIERGTVAEAHVDLKIGDGRVWADGAPGAGPVVVNAEGFDLTVLEQIAGERFAGWKGLVDAEATLTGKLEEPRITGTASALGLVIPGQLNGLDGTLRFDSDGRTVQVEAQAATGGATVATLSGRLPVALGSRGVRLDKDMPIEATATLSPQETEALEKLLTGRMFPKAHVEGVVHFSGTLHDPKAELDAAIQLRGEGTPAATIRADIDHGQVVADVSLSVDNTPRGQTHVETSVDVDELRGWVDGGPLPSLQGALTGTVGIKRFPVATVRRFVAIPEQIDGSIDGDMILSGSVDAPTFGGDLALVGGRVGDVGLSRASLHLAPEREGYTVAADVAFGRMLPGGSRRQRLLARVRAERPSCATNATEPAGSFAVAGFVPLVKGFALDRPGLDLTVSGAGFPLAAAESFTTQLTETSGCLVATGKVEGTLAAPDLQLVLDLKDAATALPNLGIRVEDAQLDATFNGSEVQIRSLTARTMPGLGADSLIRTPGGTLRMTGSATVGPEPSAEARVTMDRAWLLARSDQRAQVSGDVKLKLKEGKVDTTGTLVLDEGYLRVGERFFAGDRATRLDPDIEVVRTTPLPEQIPGGQAKSMIFRPSISIDLARHARVDVSMPLQGAYGDFGRALTTVTVRSVMDGKLNIGHAGEALRITGEITTEGGRADVLGRPFELGEGTVAFTGVDYTAPILDLTAVHHASEGDISVAIGGVPAAPTLAFTSDTINEADVLAVLVLGAPLDELDGAAGGSALLGVATSLLSNQVSSGRESSVRIDSFAIDESATSIGVALGGNVTLTTGYHFDVIDPTRENLFDVSMALALPKRWYLELSTGSARVSTAAAYWKLRF